MQVDPQAIDAAQRQIAASQHDDAIFFCTLFLGIVAFFCIAVYTNPYSEKSTLKAIAGLIGFILAAMILLKIILFVFLG